MGILKAYGRPRVKLFGTLRGKLQIFFGFMHISRCTQVFTQKQRIHASIALKVTYRHKNVFFGDNIGTSKYNMDKRGPKSL